MREAQQEKNKAYKQERTLKTMLHLKVYNEKYT